jgi:hypothetical protein
LLQFNRRVSTGSGTPGLSLLPAAAASYFRPLNLMQQPFHREQLEDHRIEQPAALARYSRSPEFRNVARTQGSKALRVRKRRGTH